MISQPLILNLTFNFQQTPSQITAIIWSPTKKEILSTHGYPTNALMLHAYPSMERVSVSSSSLTSVVNLTNQVAEIRDAHDQRVLYTALSPAGDVVVTGAGDEALKFWRIWDSVCLLPLRVVCLLIVKLFRSRLSTRRRKLEDLWRTGLGIIVMQLARGVGF